jgi:transposase-like protein
MPWREVSVMDERHEFVRLAMQEGANRRELCRRFGISPMSDEEYNKRLNEMIQLPELDDPNR